MKKTIFILTILVFLTSCKTSKSVSCEAYGYIQKENVEFDIQKINQENTSKYVTTFTIK